jgi:hypothetical protein
MKIAWQEVRLVAEKVCYRPADAIRLSNLCILAAIAFDLGLIRNQNRKVWGPAPLHNCLDRLALAPLPKTTKSVSAWSSLAQVAQKLASLIVTTGEPDEWIAAIQSADFGQKTRGAYATPSSFAMGLVRMTLRPFLGTGAATRVIDPSAGAGALLIAALRTLSNGSNNRELRSIVYGIHGVEVDPASRELCCLLLWLNAARARPDLKKIAENVVVDNAITRDWWSSQSGTFDALVMNPPWESLRHSVSDNDPHANSRIETIERLSRQETVSPDLPPLYSAQGKGDRNLFKAFVELAPHLIRNEGRIGALIPAAFASDLGMAPLRSRYFTHFQLESWTGFENLRQHFPIDGRYKFGILVGARSRLGTKSIAVKSFATEPEELEARHVIISSPMIKKLGGASQMLPELRDEAEVRVLSRMFECGTPLFELGSMMQVRYKREVDLTLDRAAKKFHRFDAVPDLCRSGASWIRSKDNSLFVPLVEGRMVGRYDVFQKSWVRGSGRTAQWQMNGVRSLSECTPQFLAEPQDRGNFRIAICDVTSATNTRTVHATLVPETWTCGNTAPVLLFQSETLALAGLAILNSLVFDWMARRIVGGLHLNKFYLATLVWPNLDVSAIGRLSHLAATMIKQSPRIPDCLAKSVYFQEAGDIQPRVDTSALTESEIEREVSMAYQLAPDMLRRILSTDRNDRRGFWRYFAAYPSSLAVLRKMLDGYGREEPLSPVSAVA